MTTNVDIIERQVGSIVGKTSDLVKRFSLNMGLGFAADGSRTKVEPTQKGKGEASRHSPIIMKRTIDGAQVEELRLA